MGGALKPSWLSAALLGAAVVWADGPIVAAMVRRWSIDPRYSHGFLVPLFAFGLLRHRSIGRGAIPPASSRAAWGGVALLGLAAAVRWAAARYFLPWFEGITLLPALAGLALVAGGWPALGRAWPSIAFLGFMVPLPHRVEVALGTPLQHAATRGSTCVLQMFGFPAFAEGHVIALGETRIGVVEACNGLGMLFTFTAMTTAVALVVRRPPLDRVLIVLSAAPIALLANIARISVTGLLHETAGGHVADAVYHDLAGWLMMPLALVLLWAEVQVLSRLFVSRPGPEAEANANA